MLVNTNKLEIELNFYRTIVKGYFFSEKLTDMWEQWRFHFIVNNQSDNNLLYVESGNQKLKENRIRNFMFILLEKVKNILN